MPAPTKYLPSQPACLSRPRVSITSLRQSGLPLTETTYLAVGGGMGSFIWVDYLRIHGADPAQIMALGFETKPYARCRRLCQNSQIPDHERLRSDSGATPDNIWGWPGYAVREAWRDLSQGNLPHALTLLWQIFTEPVLAETFTPQAGAVFAAIDREADRIGWEQIWRFGRVQAIRQTTDGRYVALYNPAHDHPCGPRLVIAPYLHLAPGYPRLRFLPDLQGYRRETGDFQQFVNAYEPHEHIYRHLRRHGGVVLLRGRGIVASRIIQRLAEERQRNPHIHILHLMRDAKPEGSHYARARRLTVNHFTHQTFNFPKSCFGGDLLVTFEQADDRERARLIDLWGGTTTARRQVWEEAIEAGLNEGWYQIRFGEVVDVKRQQHKLVTSLQAGGGLPEQACLLADFIIDATGLESEPQQNPLVADLIQTYNLDPGLNGRLKVEDDFAVAAMSNGSGRVYAGGAITLGGPFAPVDSFTGLQYAARRSLESLIAFGAPGLRPLTPARSLSQWLRWARGLKP